MADPANIERPPMVESIVKLSILFYQVALAYIEAVLNLFKKARRKDVRASNVLITGSGHGLGRELALGFARLGANLILVDINEAHNLKVRDEIIEKYPNLRVSAHSIDIRDENKVALLAEECKRKLGPKRCVDILVNNAGIVQCRPLFDLSPQLVERTFQVNCLAHIWMAKHFLPDMIEQKRGHIVAISSIAGLIGNKYLSDYCASKFAVVGFMEALECELHDGDANPGIHLTTVCPSCMSTGMFKSFTSRFDWLLPVLKPEEVAASTIDAILTNKTRVVVPPITLYFHRLSYIIPNKVRLLIQDYLDYGVKPHSD